jgi:uncharacterized membrane protein YbhN (UPF0104 family)
MRGSFASHSVARPDFIVDSRGGIRRAKGLSGLAMISLAAAAGVATFTAGSSSGDALIASSRAAVRSAADLIRARSPGLRSRAHLIKTKFERPMPRIARAAPRLRRPAPAIAALAPPPIPTPLFFDSPDLAPAFPALLAGPVPILEDVGGLPCCFNLFNPPISTVGGFAIGGFGGGGGVVPPIGGGGGTPPGVPEPSSWGMMILGFSLLGTAWRRRRKLVKRLPGMPQLFRIRLPLLAYAPRR